MGAGGEGEMPLEGGFVYFPRQECRGLPFGMTRNENPPLRSQGILRSGEELSDVLWMASRQWRTDAARQAL
jgi:hypothetical protein